MYKKNLKQNGALLLFFLCLAADPRAQIKVGINAGKLVSTAHIESDNPLPGRYRYQPGYTLGVIAEFPIDEYWGFSSGIDFVRKGVVRNYDTVPGRDKVIYQEHMKTRYFELSPFTIRYSPNGKRGFFFGAGPVIGLGVAGKVRVQYPRSTCWQKTLFRREKYSLAVILVLPVIPLSG